MKKAKEDKKVKAEKKVKEEKTVGKADKTTKKPRPKLEDLKPIKPRRVNKVTEKRDDNGRPNVPPGDRLPPDYVPPEAPPVEPTPVIPGAGPVRKVTRTAIWVIVGFVVGAFVISQL